MGEVFYHMSITPLSTESNNNNNDLTLIYNAP